MSACTVLKVFWQSNSSLFPYSIISLKSGIRIFNTQYTDIRPVSTSTDPKPPTWCVARWPLAYQFWSHWCDWTKGSREWSPVQISKPTPTPFRWFTVRVYSCPSWKKMCTALSLLLSPSTHRSTCCNWLLPSLNAAQSNTESGQRNPFLVKQNNMLSSSARSDWMQITENGCILLSQDWLQQTVSLITARQCCLTEEHISPRKVQ